MDCKARVDLLHDVLVDAGWSYSRRHQLYSKEGWVIRKQYCPSIVDSADDLFSYTDPWGKVQRFADDMRDTPHSWRIQWSLYERIKELLKYNSWMRQHDGYCTIKLIHSYDPAYVAGQILHLEIKSWQIKLICKYAPNRILASDELLYTYLCDYAEKFNESWRI